MDWQAIVVATVVLLALVYLGRRAYRTFQRPSCSDCEGCESKGKAGPQPLVQIRIRRDKGEG